MKMMKMIQRPTTWMKKVHWLPNHLLIFQDLFLISIEQEKLITQLRKENDERNRKYEVCASCPKLGRSISLNLIVANLYCHSIVGNSRFLARPTIISTNASKACGAPRYKLASVYSIRSDFLIKGQLATDKSTSG